MSWGEMLIVAMVALIVVGPKDLPGMFRKVGQFTAKAKRMARDFSRAMEDAADDAGVADVQKTFQAATNPAKAALDSVTDTVKKSVEDLDPDSATGRLSKERAEAAQKIRDHSAKVAQDRIDREAAAKVAEAKPKAAAKRAAKGTTKTAAKTKSAAKPKAKPAAKPKAKAPAKTAAKPKASKPKKAST
jgi:sec-independent protein translocase protein TatB